jgi:60 kDa SS-A/Ro ribonucleoprotein
MGLEPLRLAQYLVKYQQRDGWAHRDLLRLAHPKPKAPIYNDLFRYAVKGFQPGDFLSDEGIIGGFELAKIAEDKKEIVRLIEKCELTREMIPTKWLNEPEVWDALLQKMPPEATIRNLGKMTSVGLLAPFSAASKLVNQRLHDVDHLRKARIHPFKVLIALKTYANGHGDKGKLSWTPVPQIKDALDDAFYACFKNVEPTGKRILMGLDVSGSMTSQCGSLPISCAEAVAAQAMVFARLEQEYYVHGFATTFVDLGITAKDTLAEATRKANKNNFGGTDCSVPVLWALGKKLPVDAFIVMTDNETWAGKVHPQKALKSYRDTMGIPAKEIVVGMVASKFSIADPADPLTLDVVGMDTSVPEVVANFIRG